ncbi:M15 family metallopeptidase [Nocardioides sp.]|uniref:M15 family metallopeptidase n=1 Tax=Nocardioides sp. TaxID=35761 RepID=UPI003515C169
MSRRAVVVVLALLLAGCGAAPGPVAGPTPDPGRRAAPAPTAPAPTPPATAVDPPDPDPGYSDWPLGTRVLPLRADGFGVVRATPRALRERRYPTTDLLPPPADGRFHATITALPPDVRARLVWEPGCPVTLADLRYLTVSFRGFDGAAHTGELVVAASQARGVAGVFRTLFRADFPIEEMRLPTQADVDAPPTGDGNDTAAYVCRAAVGSATYSEHAKGLALDLNPFQNPYLKGDLVLPERARSYLDRDRVRPGMITPDSVAVRAFARIGWSWGGAWRSLKDYQHFSATGR